MNNQVFNQIKNYIAEHTRDMVNLQKQLTAIPALAPENGGEGEYAKANLLEAYLRDQGIDNIQHYDAPDARVPGGKRPNLLATIPGKKDDYAIWVCAHLDVVPAGELSLWNSNPWELIEKDGKIYGRGVEDNQQGLVSGVLAALAFVQQGIVPEHSIKLLFMADEEVGSTYGMLYLLQAHREIFSKNDRILIPDGGDSSGKCIEIAEKNLLWLRFHTVGKQAHGSRPDLGNNAKIAAADLALQIYDLQNFFNQQNDIFEPPYSTFQPTLQQVNVTGVNMIPGDDVFCADCRIIPCYSLDTVRAEVARRVAAVEQKYGVRIEVSEEQSAQSPATAENAPVVQELKNALNAVHGINARLIGIGGGTVAAGLRNAGFHTVVWSTLAETAHQPNEYAIIENIGTDAMTIAYMACI